MKLLASLAAASTFCGVAFADTNYAVAKKIVNQRFSQSSQALMLKVVGCETGQKYNSDAYNSSGATGYFQILQSHDGTTYSYNGISVTVDRNRLFNPRYNTLVAYVMSHDGKDLSPWYSSRLCWGS